MACVNGYGKRNKMESHYKTTLETEFSPPVTRSRKNKHVKRLIPDDPLKNDSITNYFQIVGTVDCFKPQFDEKTNGDHFELDVDDIKEIIYSEKPDNKKAIINSIFKKDNCSKLSDDDVLDVDSEVRVKKESFESDLDTELKIEIDDSLVLPNLRLSPRKHASTLQRCATVKENIKTPHRISLCENTESPANGVSFQNNKHPTRRRLNAKFSKVKPKKLAETDEIKSEDIVSAQEIKSEVVVNKPKRANGIVEPKIEKKANGFSENHKLTEYFPVRRSVRKTKKEVMEEKLRDLELAIEEQREEGLEIVAFEGKGRGIVASRHFFRGDFVVEYAGELIDTVEARQREARYAQEPAAGCYMYYFRCNDQHYCIDATPETGRLGRLVNHSRNGNLVTKSVMMKTKPHLVLIANQDIVPGEEVTYDYGDRSKESLLHHPWLAF